MSFDHREPGTDPDRWTTFLDGRDGDPLDPTTFGAVVVVSPHPDDETLGAGGLIARAADADVPVHVVLATLGESSHPDSPTSSPDRLAAIRETEFRAALHVLHGADARQGVHAVPRADGGTVLGIPDGGLREHPDVLRAAVGTAIAGARAASTRPVLVVAPWGGDGHRDHRIAAEVTEAVVRDLDAAVVLVEYPIWAWHWSTPDAADMPWDRLRTVRLDGEEQHRKRVALGAYVSQLEPLSPAAGDEPIVDARHARHFDRSLEVFFAVPEAATSRSRESFEGHYRRHPEGWDFTGSWYERRKRMVTLAALPAPAYRRALEIGCATGVLTRDLTDRADTVLGIDIAEAPLAIARRTAPDATFARMSVPAEWPDGRFDLVVMSEVGYYLSPADLDGVIDRVLASLDDDGVLVACHWRHPDTEAPSDAGSVHARLRARWSRPPLVTHEEEDFVLEVFPGAAVESVARAEGRVR